MCMYVGSHRFPECMYVYVCMYVGSLSVFMFVGSYRFPECVYVCRFT